MFLIIVQQAPRWVWILLAVLIAVGVSQSFARRRSLGSAIAAPLAMIVLSLYGVLSAFPFQAPAIIAWAGGVAASLALARSIVAWRAISWSASDRCLEVPGSWAPMALILGIFTMKFAVGALLATHPELVRSGLFGATAGFTFGALSGAFLSRGVAMWQTAHLDRQRAKLAPFSTVSCYTTSPSSAHTDHAST